LHSERIPDSCTPLIIYNEFDLLNVVYLVLLLLGILPSMKPDENIVASVLRFYERIQNSESSIPDKQKKLRLLFNIIVEKVSEETKVLFTSSFARISYISGAYDIHYKEAFLLHAYRKANNSKSFSLSKEQEWRLGIMCIKILLSYWLGQNNLDKAELEDIYTSLSDSKSRKHKTFERLIKVELQQIKIDEAKIIAQLYEEPFSTISISYGINDRNEDYTELMSVLHNQELLPLSANLLDVEIYDDGLYAPSSIVLEPDMLYTVTSIADCFGAFTSHDMGYLLKKFTAMPTSAPLIVGNIANFFLDQLIYKPSLSFKELTKHIFKIDPIGLTRLNDHEIRQMIQELHVHFRVIKSVVQNQLEGINISAESGLVEPSFYSAKYGIYGRLDLFGSSPSGISIVELKSGKPFRANAYGLSNTHYHQTLLYDMLIESVYGNDHKRNNFILYSKEQEKPLRYAPALKSQQREAIKARNRLYLHDRAIQKAVDPLLYIEQYAERHLEHIKGYQKKESQLLLKAIQHLDKVERSYSNALLRFTLNEWLINKVGHSNNQRSRGLAALWTQSIEEKKEQYNILNQLTLKTNKAEEDDPILIFHHSNKTASISNFRKGDLGVLYPFTKDTDAILKNQVFKVTVLSFETGRITVRLRSRQDNAKIFRQHTFWNIEHDSLDNGYSEMTRAIYEWAKTEKSYRDLILGRRCPNSYITKPIACHHSLTTEQSQIFDEIIAAEDYYLLWGPPGTGKTSVMLKEVAEHFIHHRSERILLLAYTNRAVDEICEALSAIEPVPSFLRIGSRYSTGEKFLSHLLDQKTANCTSRQELIEALSNEQIYVGTVASVLGKKALFDLISFDIAIVDEASQILEHSLIGLLSRVKKFVLIGDHKQLPAVVQQDNSISQIQDPALKELGFENLNNSLFERLFLTTKKNGWDHANGQLTYQGRMHQELMAFPSEYFYAKKLQVIPSLERLTSKLASYASDSILASKLSQHRLLFLPSKMDNNSESIKVNIHEAEICGEILVALLEIYRSQKKTLNKQSIGIITPYRAQIARIRQTLIEKDPTLMELISIDTVERYQGGARDIIIMSASMNYAFQMNALVSLSQEGIDRKLNVALTRAREQFILIGNPNILKQNKLYNKLIVQAEIIEQAE
jgi:DNA replication ATP-dependent helicase Dna2